jgi:3-phenylpropionate/trans-cinnamate dioxygenase ferredoxin subunit
VKDAIMTEQPPTDQVPDKETLEQITRRLDSLVQTFERHPIVQVRDEANEMLSLIDALHRQGLRHLVEALLAQGPALLDQALEDPAVHILLTLYDLLPPGPREQVEMALETVGPYISSKGGSIEVLDVIDGVVHLHLSGPDNGGADSMATFMQDIEMALREGFPGFRSIEVHDRIEVSPPAHPGSFIPLQQVRTINRPVFTAVAPVESLPPGTLKGVEVEGTRILLCSLDDGNIYAYHNACAGSVLPLDLGQLKRYTLLCPWHNCLYDMRTGKRLDGGTGRLAVIPVAIRDGMIQLALNVEPQTLRVPQAPGKPGGRS